MENYVEIIDDIVTQFNRHGYDPYEMVEIDFYDKKRECKIMRMFYYFVGQFLEKGFSREAMEEDGWYWPPIYPGIDIETDWKRFIRWMKKQRNYFTVEQAFVPKHLREEWDDETYQKEVDRTIAFLEKMQIIIHIHTKIGPKDLYEYLDTQLSDEKFQIMAENTTENIIIGSYDDDLEDFEEV